MKSNIIRKSAAIAAAALMIAGVAAVAVPKTEIASANSAPHYWNGTTSTGITFTGENCPLEVEREELTFELNEFPKRDNTVQGFLNYSGSVTAEYKFVNPTDSEIKATLAFPFGRQPDYAPYYDENDRRVKDVDTEKYTVKIDGEDASPTLRHTYFNGYSFNYDIHGAQLRDDFAEDSFFKTDLPVYKYTFNATVQTDGEFYSVADIPLDKTKTKIAGYTYLSDSYDGGIKITWYNQTTASKTFYVIGDDIDASEIQWKFYIEKFQGLPIIGGHWVKETVEGSAEFEEKEQTTFKEFALTDRDEDDVISEIDYYNGVVDYYNNYSSGILSANCGVAFSNLAMRWYVYDMTVAAGQSVINSVTVPMYPTIRNNVYKYEYYLSPAAKWASFGDMEINIKTPYYLIEGGDKFEKTEEGFKFTATGLPQGELEFSLAESENPETSGNKIFTAFIIACAIVAVLGGIAVLGVIIWAIIYGCKKG